MNDASNSDSDDHGPGGKAAFARLLQLPTSPPDGRGAYVRGVDGTAGDRLRIELVAGGTTVTLLIKPGSSQGSRPLAIGYEGRDAGPRLVALVAAVAERLRGWTFEALLELVGASVAMGVTAETPSPVSMAPTEPQEPRTPEEPQEPRTPEEPQEPRTPEEPQEPRTPANSGPLWEIIEAAQGVFGSSLDGHLDRIPADLAHLSFYQSDPALGSRFLFYSDTKELLHYSRLLAEGSILIRCGSLECINANIPLFYFFYGFLPALATYGAFHPLSAELQAKLDFRRLTGDAETLLEPLLAISTALEVTDEHIVFGPEDMIEETLTELLQDDYSPCIFSHSCINKVIGTDLDGIISRVSRRNRTQIVQDCNIGLEQFHENVVRIYNDSFGERPPPTRRARSVNLVGLDRDRSLTELLCLLAQLGITANEICVPNVSLTNLENLERADLQVLYPLDGYAPIYEQLFRKLTVKTIMPPAPYGERATLAWIREIAATLDVDPDACALWTETVAAWRGRCRELQEKAARYRVGLILAPGDVEVLLRPTNLLFGVELLGLLEEMGFSLDVLVPFSTHSEPALEKVRSVLREPARHAFHSAASPDEIPGWIERTPCHCIYSDLKGDARTLAGGKPSFSLFLFEKGLQGFQRSLESLLGLCTTSYYHDYRAYRGRVSRPVAR